MITERPEDLTKAIESLDQTRNELENATESNWVRRSICLLFFLFFCDVFFPLCIISFVSVSFTVLFWFFFIFYVFLSSLFVSFFFDFYVVLYLLFLHIFNFISSHLSLTHFLSQHSYSLKLQNTRNLFMKWYSLRNNQRKRTRKAEKEEKRRKESE